MADLWHLWITGFCFTLSVCTATDTDFNALFYGIALVGSNGSFIAGDLTWSSADDTARTYAFYGLKYGNSKRFEDSWINYDFTYLKSPNRDKYGPQCAQGPGFGGPPTGGPSDGGGGGLPSDQGGPPPSVKAVQLGSSEDCLFLDIYIPTVYSNQQLNSRKPVIFFTHGGGFTGGNKSPGSGIKFSRALDVIYVAIQYRLGLLGFLSTDDLNAPGNYGVSDIKNALKWIHQNIENFGGDCSKITIMGQSAGSMLTSGLMLDQKIRDIVHGVILESGSILSPMAITKTPLQNAQAVAAVLNCSTTDTTQMVACFKLQSPDALAAGFSAAFPQNTRGPGEDKFTMVVDGNHIRYKPEWILQSEPWNYRGGLFSGFMANDSSLLMQGQTPDMFLPGTPTLDYIRNTYIALALRPITYCTQPPDAVVNAVYNRYGFANAADFTALRELAVRMTTDIMWRIPGIKEATLYASKQLAQLGNQVFTVAFDDNIGELNFHLSGFGAYHVLDLDYLQLSDVNSTGFLGDRTNAQVTRQMQLLWKYVAYNGKGFGDQFDPKIVNYLQLGQEQVWTKSEHQDYADLVVFYDKIYAVGCSAQLANDLLTS